MSRKHLKILMPDTGVPLTDWLGLCFQVLDLKV